MVCRQRAGAERELCDSALSAAAQDVRESLGRV